jgi:DNA sulfur modification protein DndB
MSNKTLIPAFECAVGNWTYYVAVMKFAEVERQVKFAYELNNNNQELGEFIQRGLSNRTKEITEYLLRSEHRFFGALIVAAWGGHPQYTPLSMTDEDGILRGMDKGFGVLAFDGSQSYFALDGQHRLKAIKDALARDASLGAEEICVIFVTHINDENGRIRTRRLFSNINRNAKKTAAAEDIVLDEDDGFAVLCRRLIQEQPLLKIPGRVKVVQNRGSSGELKLAGNSINRADADTFTTLPVLYDMLQYLGSGLPSAITNRKARPTNEQLESAYQDLFRRVTDVIEACGNIPKAFEQGKSARELRNPKGEEEKGHPFMRPVIQKAVCRALGRASQSHDWNLLMARLRSLNWRLEAAPWTAVFNRNTRRMLSSKEHADLLTNLIGLHLAPPNAQAIKRYKKAYKELLNETYPVPDAELQRLIVNGSETEAAMPQVSELSEELTVASQTADDDGDGSD